MGGDQQSGKPGICGEQSGANGPRKPWVSKVAIEYMAHRRALAAEGHEKEATAMDNMVRAQLQEDLAAWVSRGLQTKFWERIKALQRTRAQAVALYPTGPRAPVQLPRHPSQVYAEYLDKTQWGKEEEGPGEGEAHVSGNAREPETFWGTPLTGPGGQSIQVGRIEEDELAEAISKAKSGRVPGLGGIPAELWKALDRGRETVSALVSRCWEEGQTPNEWRKSMVAVGLPILRCGRVPRKSLKLTPLLLLC